MEATYYKDTMRSYMIIPCPEEAETENYQYRMLEMNRITGLLPCGLRHIDGMRYLYYDITGKQSMQSLYEGRKISGTEFLRLIRELDRVSESISGYLLDEQHLILSQEQVFYELQTGNYYFTYYPGEIMPPEIFRFLHGRSCLSAQLCCTGRPADPSRGDPRRGGRKGGSAVPL